MPHIVGAPTIVLPSCISAGTSEPSGRVGYFLFSALPPYPLPHRRLEPIPGPVLLGLRFPVGRKIAIEIESLLPRRFFHFDPVEIADPPFGKNPVERPL